MCRAAVWDRADTCELAHWMDAEVGPVRLEAWATSKEEIYGWSKREHEVSWCERRMHRTGSDGDS